MAFPGDILLDLLNVVGLERLHGIQPLAVQLSAVDLVVELAVLRQVLSELVYFPQLLQLLILSKLGCNLHRSSRRGKGRLHLRVAPLLPALVRFVELQRVDS